MKTIRRTSFLTAAASAGAGIASCRFPASAAEFAFKWATEATPKSHITIRLNEAAQKILAATNGRVEITVFPSSQLGGQIDILSQVRLGAVQFTSSLDVNLSSLVPLAGIFTLPYLFTSQKEAMATSDGPLGKYRRDAIAKMNLYAFPKTWDQDFRQVMTVPRPVRVPDDLKGLKIRTADSPVEVALFKALGATPTPVTMSGIFTALQTHLVDGMVSPINGIEDLKLYEIAKNIAYTNHIWSSITMIANGDMWRGLPANLRDTIEREVTASTILSNGDTARLHASLEAELIGQGVAFTHPETLPFQQAVQRAGIYTSYKTAYGPEAWALLEKAVGRNLA